MPGDARKDTFQLGGKLRVFLSSTIGELRDARSFVSRALNQLYIDALVYEENQPTTPVPVPTTCFQTIQHCDLLIALFARQFGDITIEEFKYARTHGKPCFVYILQPCQDRDPRLEEFLRRNVYDLENGVTYGYFNTAVELGDKIGRDILLHLTHVYRQSRREVPAGSISPVVKLAWDVADWLACFDHKLIKEPCFRDNRTVDLCMQKEIIIPGHGKVHKDVKVRCCSGMLGTLDTVHFLEYCGESDGRLVSDLPISNVVRRMFSENKNIVCETFEELLDQTVRFDSYLDSLEAEIKRRGVDKDYIPLECVEDCDGSPGFPSSGTVDTETFCPMLLDEYVEIWLKDFHREHLSILGEFGTGKTWTVYHLAWLALRKYREAKESNCPRPRLPLVVELSDYAKSTTVESLFSDFLFRRHNIGIPSYEAFRQLNRMGKLLLLFDGFDEMATRVDREGMTSHFWELARALVPGGKTILTCRKEHFDDAKQGRDLLNAELKASTAMLSGAAPQFLVVELQRFDTPRVRRALERRAAPGTVEKIMQNPDLVDLASRPLIIDFILQALPNLQDGKPYDLARVFLIGLRHKMESDIRDGRTFTSLADKLYFLCEVAWEMVAANTICLNYRLFPERLQRLFGSAVASPTDLDQWRHDMMGQSLLIRNSRGDYTPAHRSIMEFLVGYKLVAALGVMAPEYLEFARSQSNIDTSAPPKDYSWSEYFRREFDAEGHSKKISPLNTFVLKEGVPDIGLVGGDMGLDKLPRNALVFAASMVSKEPACLATLCELASEGTGQVAWNVQCFLPYLKEYAGDALAENLVSRIGDGPVKRGVAWLLGELGVASPGVLKALQRTVTSLGKPGGPAPEDWSKAAFALEKLGQLGPDTKRQSGATVAYLTQHLPPDYTLESAWEGLRRSFTATDPILAKVNTGDVLAIAKFETEIDCTRLFREIFSGIDFGHDLLGRRAFYAVFLAGHLGISESVDRVIQATQHPHGSVRNCACEALAKLGNRSAGVIAAIEGSLKDNYYRVRYRAAWSIGYLELAASLPALDAAIRREEIRYVRDEMERVRTYLTPADIRPLPAGGVPEQAPDEKTD